MPTTFPFPSSLFCLPVILFAETRTSAPLYHILVFVPQSRKTCAVDSSSSPQSGHNASNLSLQNFRLLRVGRKLFVILYRLILILLGTFRPQIDV
ncbi:hypothetical protein ES332_D06G113600v1 [Gossypium tomentosum]|uniref:Secreted protein n=1 Tax=Gossypium tomentosum TaxID=34277 RepID=A0A5D2KHS8_GOSTO|nr:hypothetical protein ES332_D06G113600v1 [Gossypium tomentosum]